MVGGDWAEGWQYGPFSVLNYAAATRALEDNGASLPEMDAWVNSLIVRYIHGTIPTMDAQYAGAGDFDSDQVYQDPAQNEVDAVRWLGIAEAVTLLSYPRDRELVAAFDRQAP